MQIVFLDIVAYSKRKSHAQATLIKHFMDSVKGALLTTSKEYLHHTNQRYDVLRDLVIIPSGDGAALAFPFEGIHDIHLTFTGHLLRSISTHNAGVSCKIFQANGWCPCHSAFLLRCGLSEGKLLLYRDLNDNYNVAGEAINMAARVMGIANPGQVFMTSGGYQQLEEMVPGTSNLFVLYPDIEIKHGISIDAYQYVNKAVDGLSSTLRADLLKDSGGSLQELPDTRPSSADADVVSSADHPLPNYLKTFLSGLTVIPSGIVQSGNIQSGLVQVSLSRSYLIDRFPMTQGIYSLLTGTNPSHFIGENLPVDNVSWLDAIVACNRLSELTGLSLFYSIIESTVGVDESANGFRLPTEAEWEHACLGLQANDPYGPLSDISWYSRNSDGMTHPVGQKTPNLFGLHDMLGNVWEWCHDWHQKKLPPNPSVDYSGPVSGFERVLHGGSFLDQSSEIAARSRSRRNPRSADRSIGFRVVRNL